MAIFLLCFGVLVVSVAGRSLRFSPPTVICTGNQPYVVGYRSVGLQPSAIAAGPCSGSMYGTTDGGASFSRIDGVDVSTVSSFVDAAGTLWNFNGVGDVSSPMDHFTSFSSNSTQGVAYNGSWHPTGARGTVSFSGLSPGVTCGDPAKPREYGCPFRLSGTGWVRLPDASLVMSAIVYWGGGPPTTAQFSTSVVAFRSVDDGMSWTFSGVIANASQVNAQEGPNENDLTLLPNGDVLCVVRLDAGDGFATHPYLPYSIAISTDGGHTWSPPKPLPKTVGCARPRLQTFGSTVVLSGGRLSPTNRDIFLWRNDDGTGATWSATSVTYVHNALETNSSLHFTPAVNSSTARETTSYTSLVRTNSTHGFLTYSRVLPPQPDVVFAMQFEVTP